MSYNLEFLHVQKRDKWQLLFSLICYQIDTIVLCIQNTCTSKFYKMLKFTPNVIHMIHMILIVNYHNWLLSKNLKRIESKEEKK